MILKYIILFLLALTFANAEAYVSQDMINNVAKKYNKFAENRFINMEHKLEGLQDKTTIIKLNTVNTFFNQVNYLR